MLGPVDTVPDRLVSNCVSKRPPQQAISPGSCRPAGAARYRQPMPIDLAPAPTAFGWCRCCEVIQWRRDARVVHGRYGCVLRQRAPADNVPSGAGRRRIARSSSRCNPIATVPMSTGGATSPVIAQRRRRRLHCCSRRAERRSRTAGPGRRAYRDGSCFVNPAVTRSASDSSQTYSKLTTQQLATDTSRLLRAKEW